VGKDSDTNGRRGVIWCNILTAAGTERLVRSLVLFVTFSKYLLSLYYDFILNFGDETCIHT
jgi:hypothetical protein